MPPVAMREHTKIFIPDYSALVVCEKLTVDGETYERLCNRAHHKYRIVSEMMQTLYSDGFIELVDYESILNENNILLQRMLAQDMKMLDMWIDPLCESLHIWEDFWFRTISQSQEDVFQLKSSYESITREIRGDMHSNIRAKLHNFQNFRHMIRDRAVHDMIVHPGHRADINLSLWSSDDESIKLYKALHSSRKRHKKEYRDILRRVLRSYLEYVDANLILSNHLEVGFHDWMDFLPFYRTKFLAIGQENPPGEAAAIELRKLFDISFPELTVKSTSQLMKIINDNRIDCLRSLVQSTVQGDMAFDNEFAKRTLTEVIGIEQKVARWRNIVSYATMPIGFIPWIGSLAQKGVEEAIIASLQKKLKAKYQWYYLLSDVMNKK
jgi:hypothetical protein